MFRSIANAREECLGKSETFFLKIIFIFINIFLFIALESLIRDDDSDTMQSDSTYFEENVGATTPNIQHVQQVFLIRLPAC